MHFFVCRWLWGIPLQLKKTASGKESSWYKLLNHINKEFYIYEQAVAHGLIETTLLSYSVSFLSLWQILKIWQIYFGLGFRGFGMCLVGSITLGGRQGWTSWRQNHIGRGYLLHGGQKMKREKKGTGTSCTFLGHTPMIYFFQLGNTWYPYHFAIITSY